VALAHVPGESPGFASLLAYIYLPPSPIPLLLFSFSFNHLASGPHPGCCKYLPCSLVPSYSLNIISARWLVQSKMNKKEKTQLWTKRLKERIPDLKQKRLEALLKQLSRILPGKPRSEHAVTRDLDSHIKALEKVVDRAPDAILWISADISENTIIPRAKIEAFLFAQDYTGESGVPSTVAQLEKLDIPIHGTDGNREWDPSLPTKYAVRCDPTAETTDEWASRALGETTETGNKSLYTSGDDGRLIPSGRGKSRISFAIPDTSDIFQLFSIAPPNKETVSEISAAYKATKEEAKEKAERKKGLKDGGK